MALIIEPTRILMRASGANTNWYWASLSTDGGTVWLGEFTEETVPPDNANESFMLMGDNTLAYRVRLITETDALGGTGFSFTFTQQSDDGTALFQLVLRLGSANIATVLRVIDEVPLLFSDLYNGLQNHSRSVVRGAEATSDYDRSLPMPFVSINQFPVLPPWIK